MRRHTHGAAATVGVLLWVAAVSGCAAGTEPSCTPTTSLMGSWSYHGAQSGPTAATLTGTLTVTSESCAGFEGSLDLVETDAPGATRRLAGPVAGQVLDSVSVRFDAFVDGGPVARQHLGALAAGSMSGTWVLAGDAGAATGSFELQPAAAP